MEKNQLCEKIQRAWTIKFLAFLERIRAKLQLFQSILVPQMLCIIFLLPAKDAHFYRCEWCGSRWRELRQ